MKFAIAVVLCFLAAFASANEYGGGYGKGGGYGDDYKAVPYYDYAYKVLVPPGKSYGGGYDDGYGKGGGYGASWDKAEFGQTEKRYGDKTTGKYFVELPDGRLQTVEYVVDGYSGYLAKVSYSSPKGGYGGGYDN